MGGGGGGKHKGGGGGGMGVGKGSVLSFVNGSWPHVHAAGSEMEVLAGVLLHDLLESEGGGVVMVARCARLTTGLICAITLGRTFKIFATFRWPFCQNRVPKLT